MPKILHYLRTAIELITAEIELLNLRIFYPKSFVANNLTDNDSTPMPENENENVLENENDNVPQNETSKPIPTSPTTETSKPALARWRGTIAELLEYIIPLQIDGKLAKPSGDPMAFIDVVTLLEQAFGIKIKAPYDRKSKLLTRKKSGTPFTDRMRQVLCDARKKLDQ